MHSKWPARRSPISETLDGSSREREVSDVLIVASSARLLAQLCADGGRTADVMDCFGDIDTRAASRSFSLLPCEAGVGFGPAPERLLHAVGNWAHRHPAGHLLIGSGFEHQAALLAKLAALLPLAGNSADSVARCKNPEALLAACIALGIAAPPILRAMPANALGTWLRKREGGCGGEHIQPSQWPGAHAFDSSTYWQAAADGEAVSLLFLTAADTTAALGVHRQYCAPRPGYPYRFAGVVSAPDLSGACQSALLDAASRLARHFALRGLNSLDALWDGSSLHVLEINPRPPASLALQERAQQAGLLQMHMAAFGLAPAGTPAPTCSQTLNAGMALVYASRTLSIPADFRFPLGCHDLPTLPHSFAADQPVCSLHTTDGGIEKLRSLVRVLQEHLLPVAGAECVYSL